MTGTENNSSKRFVVTPYKGAGEVRFEMDEADIIDIAGQPMSRSANRFGESMLWYSDFTVTLDALGVVEVSFRSSTHVIVDNTDVFKDPPRALRSLAKRDGNARELYGFVVLSKYGVALADFQHEDGSPAVTVFRRGRWDALLPESIPFDVDPERD